MRSRPREGWEDGGFVGPLDLNVSLEVEGSSRDGKSAVEGLKSQLLL